MVAPLSGARYSSGAIKRAEVAPSSGQNWIIIITATEHVFKWRHLPDKTGYHHHHGGATERCQVLQVAPSSGQNWRSSSSHMVAPLSSIQVAPSSGQNWSSSFTETPKISTHEWRHFRSYHHHHSGGATESVFKWRHLPDKTGYHHHHHMVAPLSGARYSSGAIFRTKLVEDHHHHMVAPLSGARSIQVAPSSGQNWLSSSSSHGGATERCQVFKWRHLPDKTGYHHQPFCSHWCHFVPSSGSQNWLSPIIHMVAPLLLTFFRHHHHHHMVAPLSGARYSSHL